MHETSVCSSWSLSSMYFVSCMPLFATWQMMSISADQFVHCKLHCLAFGH